MRANTKVDEARAIAVYHAGFRHIRPFQCGNGRLARLIAEIQTQKVLCRTPNPVSDTAVYRSSLRSADRSANAGPLMQALTGMQAPHGQGSFSYQIACWPASIKKELAPGRHVTIEVPDVDAAIALERARVSERVRHAAIQAKDLGKVGVALDERSNPPVLRVEPKLQRAVRYRTGRSM